MRGLMVRLSREGSPCSARLRAWLTADCPTSKTNSAASIGATARTPSCALMSPPIAATTASTMSLPTQACPAGSRAPTTVQAPMTRAEGRWASQTRPNARRTLIAASRAFACVSLIRGSRRAKRSLIGGHDNRSGLYLPGGKGESAASGESPAPRGLRPRGELQAAIQAAGTQGRRALPPSQRSWASLVLRVYALDRLDRAY